jgi:hypothetical protein
MNVFSVFVRACLLGAWRLCNPIVAVERRGLQCKGFWIQIQALQFWVHV